MTTKQTKSVPLKDSKSFRPANGLNYKRFLQQLHEAKLFDWYLEIGTNSGASLAFSRSKSISVDPFYQIQSDVVASKPALHLFQTESDKFFEMGFLERNEIKLSFSFLDGMHHFEFLLRDFMNTEAASDKNAVIAMHDCCPANSDMEKRELSEVTGKAWTGDVWKLIPILRKYRPDLSVTVLNCRPTGLVLVSNLDPKNTVLGKKYNKIIDEFMDVTLVDYGLSKFNKQFEYTDAEKVVRDGFSLFDQAETVS